VAAGVGRKGRFMFGLMKSKVKVKVSLYQAVEAHMVVRC
jgi:hypothetical protein